MCCTKDGFVSIPVNVHITSTGFLPLPEMSLCNIYFYARWYMYLHIGLILVDYMYAYYWRPCEHVFDQFGLWHRLHVHERWQVNTHIIKPFTHTFPLSPSCQRSLVMLKVSATPSELPESLHLCIETKRIPHMLKGRHFQVYPRRMPL